MIASILKKYCILFYFEERKTLIFLFYLVYFDFLSSCLSISLFFILSTLVSAFIAFFLLYYLTCLAYSVWSVDLKHALYVEVNTAFDYLSFFFKTSYHFFKFLLVLLTHTCLK